MSILNKLDVVSSNSVAPLTRIVKPDSSAQANGQVLADAGKILPNAGQVPETLSDARRRELGDALKNVSGYVQNIARELRFTVDEELGTTVVTVVDEYTGEVIRQLPSEDLLELARSLADIKEKSFKGLLFKGDA